MGGVVSTLGNFWCAEAATFPEFIVARFLAGAGAGLVLTAGQVVLADITSPDRRGRTMAIYHGVFIFAVGIGPFPGGLLADRLGLAAPFLAYGAASFLVSLLAWFAVGETRRLSRPEVGRGWTRGPTLMAQMRLLTAQVGFLLVCLVGLVNAVVRTGALFNIIPVLGSVRLGLSVAEIGGGLALGSVMGVLVAYPSGALVDRFGRKAVIVPATMVAGVSLLLFCFAPTYSWFIVACVLWGVAMSVGGSAPAAYAADLAPHGMNAAAMSTYRMVSDFGYVVGPIALGLVVDGYGSIAALVAAAGLTILVGVAFRQLAPETHRTTVDPLPAGMGAGRAGAPGPRRRGASAVRIGQAPTGARLPSLGLADDPVDHRAKGLALARPVQERLSIGVFLALRARPLFCDADNVPEFFFAPERARMRRQPLDDLRRDLSHRASFLGSRLRQEREGTVPLREPAGLLDDLAPGRGRAPPRLDLERDPPDEACVERGERDRVVDARTDVADPDFDGRVRGRRPDVPPELASILDRPDRPVRLDYPRVLRLASHARWKPRSRERPNRAQPVRLEPGEPARMER